MIIDLQQAIGAENVAFDTITCALYATDASNYQIMPIGVTFPRHADDVSAIHEIAAKNRVPVLPRGGGTSLAGQTVGQAIVMDFTRHMRRIRAINAEMKTVQVEPGLVLEQMNTQLKPLGLMFGPDPASANRATLGGCLGNNSTGTHSILYRMTSDHVKWIDVVLASGEKVRLEAGTSSNTTIRHLTAQVQDIVGRYAEPIATRYPKTWRTVAGYALNRLNPENIDLAQLIVGSAGTLATIVGAEVSLVERPKLTRLAIVHFNTLRESLDIVPTLLETEPSAVELLDKTFLDRTRNQPEFARQLQFVEGDPPALLIVEYYGNSDRDLTTKIDRLKTKLARNHHQAAVVVLVKPEDQARVWTVRKAGLGILASNRGDWKTVALIEDAAVPVEYLGAYINDIDELIRSEGAEVSLYAHASAGCLHVRPILNLKTVEGLRQYRAIGEQAVEIVLKYSGTTSGEHGEGLVRGEFRERLFGKELSQAFREIKQLFDPNNLLNPNKMVDPLRMDDPAILRYGTRYKVPLELKSTRFDWTLDHGFAGAVEMCNGAGVCRKESNGTMCPSFMATREERESTRGRANILRLAMSGVFGTEGMADEKVKAVLDLCLSCKACKVECPSSVDMARLKAEFMANYYDHHGVPRSAWLFGNIHRLNRLGSAAPWISNLALKLPFVSNILKRGLGIASERPFPRLASQRFSHWWNKQPLVERKSEKSTPILLIDTFTEFYHPKIGKALHYIGSQLGLPLRALRFPQQGCCGRPALSKGMLEQAKRMASTNITFLSKLLDQEPDARFMMLEPSCVSALRDDYLGLVRSQMTREIANRTISVEEWLTEWVADLKWDRNPREVMLHGHCHQKALWGTTASKHILTTIPNIKFSELDAGCCGMAGSFGYEHYDISMKIAERHLFPAIRHHPNIVIAASGTSCREQIGHIHGTAQHPVEIIAEACGWKP